MDYILYTTEGLTQTPKGKEIENCQIIDFQYNSHLPKQDCIQQYIDSQSSTDFNRHEIKVAMTINESIYHSIKDLVAYMKKNNTKKKKELETNISILADFFDIKE